MSAKIINSSSRTVRFAPVEKVQPAVKQTLVYVQEPVIHSEDLRNQLFDTIVKSLKPVGLNAMGENTFVAEWEWGGKGEVYYFTYRDISDMISDVLDEHPRCWDYRKAYLALIESEHGIVDPVTHLYRGGKPWYIDVAKYNKIRTMMLDLTTPTGAHIFNAITELGPNPTQGLSDDVDESKRLANLLINKLWRTKKDFTLKLQGEEVRRKMIEDILDNPLKAMQTNSYVYAAMKEHTCSWN